MLDKKIKKNYIAIYFTKILLSVIFLLVSIIFINSSDKNLLKYKNAVFKKTISFNRISDFYDKYIGDVLFMKKDTSKKVESVFNEEFDYKSSKKYKDGYELFVDNSYLIPSLQSGIVVFKGNKDDYKKCVIVQGMDGVDVWYCNLNNTSLKLYDYIEKGSLIGDVSKNKMYIVLQKDNKYLNIDEYLKKS